MSDGRRHLPEERELAHDSRGPTRSVDGTANFLVGKGNDHPLDLPPMAEFQDIAAAPAAFGKRRSFESGVIAIGFDQQCSVGKRCASGNIGRIHATPLTEPLLRFGSQTR
jgi:hypothetical protein